MKTKLIFASLLLMCVGAVCAEDKPAAAPQPKTAAAVFLEEDDDLPVHLYGWNITLATRDQDKNTFGGRALFLFEFNRIILAARADFTALPGVEEPFRPPYDAVEAIGTLGYRFAGKGLWKLSLNAFAGVSVDYDDDTPGAPAIYGAALRLGTASGAYVYVGAGRHEALGNDFRLMAAAQLPLAFIPGTSPSAEIPQRIILIADYVSGANGFFRGGIAFKFF